MEQIQHKLMLPLWAKAGGLLCIGLTIPAALRALLPQKAQGRRSSSSLTAAVSGQERGHKPCPQTEDQVCQHFQYKIIHVFLSRG